MDEVKLKGIEDDAVHWKLDALWRGARRRGKLVAVRIDRHSYRLLMRSREAYVSGDLETTHDGTRWRGMPFVYEAAPLGAVYKQAGIPTEIEREPSILTIECNDEDSGRTVYFNDPNNPPAYR